MGAGRDAARTGPLGKGWSGGGPWAKWRLSIPGGKEKLVPMADPKVPSWKTDL